MCFDKCPLLRNDAGRDDIEVVATEIPNRRRPIRRGVVPWDGSPLWEWAPGIGQALACLLTASVDVLHVDCSATQSSMALWNSAQVHRDACA